MILKTRVLRLIGWSGLMLVLGGQASRADLMTTLTADLTSLPGGITRYEYTLTNLSTSDLNVDGFVLDVAKDADLQALAGPVDWDIIYDPGDTQVVWNTADLLNYAPILPGSSAIFSFESVLGPVPTAFLITGIDDTFQLIGSNTGHISGPGTSAVPEPSGLVLLGIGGGVLCFRFARVVFHGIALPRDGARPFGHRLLGRGRSASQGILFPDEP